MKELIPIGKNQFDGYDEPSVDARQLWEKLGVKTEFSKWIKRKVVDAQLVESKDFIFFVKNGENLQRGRPTLEYILTLNAALHVLMLQGKSKKTAEVRQYFINVDREYKKKQKEELKQTPLLMLEEKKLQIEESKIYCHYLEKYAEHLKENGLNNAALSVHASIASKLGFEDSKKYLPSLKEMMYTPTDIAKERKGLTCQKVGKILKKLGKHGKQDPEQIWSEAYDEFIPGSKKIVICWRYNADVKQEVLDFYDKNYWKFNVPKDNQQRFGNF